MLIIQVLVLDGAPVGNHEAVGVVPCPWHGFDVPCRDQRAFHVPRAPLDELCPVVGELTFLLVKVDRVAHYGAYSRRGYDVRVKTVLVHRLLLLQRRAVRHIHRLSERPLDIVVVGRQVKEILVEKLDVRLRFHGEVR